MTQEPFVTEIATGREMSKAEYFEAMNIESLTALFADYSTYTIPPIPKDVAVDLAYKVMDFINYHYVPNPDSGVNDDDEDGAPEPPRERIRIRV